MESERGSPIKIPHAIEEINTVNQWHQSNASERKSTADECARVTTSTRDIWDCAEHLLPEEWLIEAHWPQIIWNIKTGQFHERVSISKYKHVTKDKVEIRQEWPTPDAFVNFKRMKWSVRQIHGLLKKYMSLLSYPVTAKTELDDPMNFAPWISMSATSTFATCSTWMEVLLSIKLISNSKTNVDSFRCSKIIIQ